MVNCSCQKNLGLIVSLICLIYIDTLYAQDNGPELVGLGLFHGSEKQCSVGNLDQCGPHESCVQTDPSAFSGLCKCVGGYQRAAPDADCAAINPAPAPPTALPTPSSLADHHRVIVGVLIPLLLVLTLVMALVYVARRYHWAQRLRAMRQRRYDEVQFGQEEDDPPLA